MSEPTGSCTVFRYVGGGRYLNGCPARDLRPADLIEVAEREGIGIEQIVASGLYVVEEQVEVAPFCGARGWESEGGGARCGVPVRAWGERCEEHEGMGPGNDDAGASKE